MSDCFISYATDIRRPCNPDCRAFNKEGQCVILEAMKALAKMTRAPAPRLEVPEIEKPPPVSLPPR